MILGKTSKSNYLGLEETQFDTRYITFKSTLLNQKIIL